MGRRGRLFVAGCLFLTPVISVQAQQACTLTQITNSTGAGLANLSPAINAAGNRIAFYSTTDLLGTNGDGSAEVFLWDAFTGLTQITNFNTPPDLTPAINAAGNRIAFRSNANPFGSNSDGGYEVFLWDASTGLAQVTNLTGGVIFTLDINDAGDRITFESTANPLGSNADGNYEIFLWDATSGLTQITNSSFDDNLLSSINASGNRIAFKTDNDYLGGNPDRNEEIFLWDSSTGLSQITNTVTLTIVGGNHNPLINAAGDRIAFASGSRVLETKGTPTFNLYRWDAATGFTQITHTPPGTLGDSDAPSINASGTRIAFYSAADLLGTNGDGSPEIFLWDASTGLAQITNGTGGHSFDPSIDAAGGRIAFSSRNDLLGTNGDGNFEIFLASCQGEALAETSIPAVSPLGLGVLAALLGLAAAWNLRRRRA